MKNYYTQLNKEKKTLTEKVEKLQKVVKGATQFVIDAPYLPQKYEDRCGYQWYRAYIHLLHRVDEIINENEDFVHIDESKDDQYIESKINK